MRILAITHQRDAGPGVFAEAIRERGDTLETWLPVEDPEPPADPLGYDGVFSLGGADWERQTWELQTCNKHDSERDCARNLPCLTSCYTSTMTP